MIDTERNCLDTVHQISAIINALRRVQKDMLSDHLAALGEAIVAGELKPQTRRAFKKSVVISFAYFSKVAKKHYAFALYGSACGFTGSISIPRLFEAQKI